MRIIKSFTLFILVGIATLGLTVASAQAANLSVNGSGLLTGANNVNVGGILYNVIFVDGSCIGLFDGCD